MKSERKTSGVAEACLEVLAGIRVPEPTHCPTCKKYLGDFINLMDMPPSECIDCRRERIKKSQKSQEDLPAPSYDIDEILDSDLKKHKKITKFLCSFGGSNPHLRLEPEIILQEYEIFEGYYPNGLDLVLEQGGPCVFLRGLRSMAAIEAKGMLSLMLKIKTLVEKQGMIFPTTIPKYWVDEEEMDSRYLDPIRDEISKLEQNEWPHDEDIKDLIIAYLERNRNLLRIRKESQEASYP